MASVEVHNLDGEVVGSVELPEAIFGIEPSEAAIYHAVKAYLTNQRQGNASTKTRAEVDLTKRKMYRQKGTGRARAGTAASPVRVGGGVAHGPRPRDLGERVPKKVRRLAVRSALALKGAEGRVRVLQDFTLEAPKTKRMAAMARAIEVSGAKALLLTAEPTPTVYKSCRNLPGFSVKPVSQMCTYDVVRAESVIFTEGALGRLQALWGNA
jgi:large subunit ribosomal protein L4